MIIISNLIILVVLFVIVGLISAAPAKFAICLTGQLARLEVLTKLKRIVVPNLQLGHKIQVFVLLDNNVTDVKQTFYKYDYSSNPYANYSAAQLKTYMETNTIEELKRQGIMVDKMAIRFHVKYAPPAQTEYPLLGSRIPVTDKKVSGFANVESAASRFQNNMRWMSTLRDCVKWMQAEEYRQRQFFNYVIRLRDDSYALGPWLFQPLERYRNKLVSANIASHHGVNDHNFVVDRRWSDAIFRGMTEDYYFNDTLDRLIWLNPEHRIYKITTSYNIELALNKVCDQPLLPLRGSENATHWRLHPAYIRIVRDYCRDKDTHEWCCDEPWMQIIEHAYVPLNPD